MRLDTPTAGFDYRDAQKNLDMYGQETVPELDVQNLKKLTFPVSLFVGNYDILSTKEDDRKLKETLGDSLGEYHEVEADHLSLLLGKDMRYFTDDVMRILKEQHPPTVKLRAEEKSKGRSGN